MRQNHSSPFAGDFSLQTRYCKEFWIISLFYSHRESPFASDFSSQANQASRGLKNCNLRFGGSIEICSCNRRCSRNFCAFSGALDCPNRAAKKICKNSASWAVDKRDPQCAAGNFQTRIQQNFENTLEETPSERIFTSYIWCIWNFPLVAQHCDSPLVLYQRVSQGIALHPPPKWEYRKLMLRSEALMQAAQEGGLNEGYRTSCCPLEGIPF